MPSHDKQPTVFHVTHHKAGSQWVAEVLKHCVADRCLSPKDDLSFFYDTAIEPGKVYLTVYVTKQEFEMVTASKALDNGRTCKYFLQHPVIYALNRFNFQIRQKPYIKLVIIRDFRDTLVSLYFSLKASHFYHFAFLQKMRSILNSVDKEQGLLHFLGDEQTCEMKKNPASPFLKNQYKLANSFDSAELISFMARMVEYLAAIQVSWLNDDVLLIKYENLLADEYTGFERIIEHCQIDISRQRLYYIVKNCSFESVTGRKQGQDDISAHQRKGIVGDWRNHFSERVKDTFKKRFGEVLIKTGYERDSNW